MVGVPVMPPAARAAPSRSCMKASWSARVAQTSVTTNVPLSDVPAKCICSPLGQLPEPLLISIPSLPLTASYSALPTPENSRIKPSATMGSFRLAGAEKAGRQHVGQVRGLEDRGRQTISLGDFDDARQIFGSRG